MWINLCNKGMPWSQLHTLPLRLRAVPLRVVWGGTCASVSLHHQPYYCTNPPPHRPLPFLPTMPEQWCSNKAILNDEHIYPPRWRVEALIEVFRAIQQSQTLIVHRWPRPAEGHCYKYTHSHTFAHVRLCNYMQQWATLIILHLLNYMHVNLRSDTFFFLSPFGLLQRLIIIFWLQQIPASLTKPHSHLMYKSPLMSSIAETPLAIFQCHHVSFNESN